MFLVTNESFPPGLARKLVEAANTQAAKMVSEIVSDYDGSWCMWSDTRGGHRHEATSRQNIVVNFSNGRYTLA